MLIVDKISYALAAIQYPTYNEYCTAHEYEKGLESAKAWSECKAYKKALLAVFTVQELQDLFTLTNGENI
jgi:hypothetical protein